MQKEPEIGIGIDFGTSNSCVGVYIDGTVKIVPNSIGERITPSVLLFKSLNEAIVGEDIFINKIDNIKNYIYEVKRFIGLDYEEFEENGFIKTLNYDVVNVDGTPQIKIESEGQVEYFTIEQISSLIIKKIIQNAENFIGSKITKAVFTVPTQFTNRQIKSIYEVAKILDIKVQRIINEPTAAALAYDIGNDLVSKKQTKPDIFCSTVLGDDYHVVTTNELVKSEENVLAFDLGGGTFDLTVLKIQKTGKDLNFDVLLTQGDIHLGGSDFDKMLMDYCMNYFYEENQFNNEDIYNIRNNYHLFPKLKAKCENAKKLLSVKNEVTIKIESFYGNVDLFLKIRQKDFEEICKPLFDRIKNLIDSVLKEVKYKPEDIDKVILVGGATRMYGIKNLLVNIFGENKIKDDINPEEAVAIGATLDSAKIQVQEKLKFTLQDIIPFDIGIEALNTKQDNANIKQDNANIKQDNANIKRDNANIKQDNVNNNTIMSPIIKKYSKIPCSKEKKFLVDLTEEFPDIVLKIYEGNNSDVRKNIFLGEYSNKNLNKKGKYIYTIILKVNINGLLTAFIKSEELNINEEIFIQNKISIGIYTGKKIKIPKNKNLGTIDDIIKNIEIKKNDIKNSIDINTRLKNLILCSQIYEELINIYKSFIKYNENILDKIFLYTKELFMLYSERIKLNKDKNEIIIKQIKEKMIDLLENPDHVEHLMGIFKDIRLESDFKNAYYSIFNNYMEMLIDKGLYYLNPQNLKRYYAKLYLEKGFFSIKNFVDIDDMTIIDKDIKEKLDVLKAKDDEELTKIDSFAHLVEIYAEEGKIIFGKTGFTKIDKKLKKLNENPKDEEILDIRNILLNMADSFVQSKKSIGEAYCLANIIIIDYRLLGIKEYDNLAYYIEKFETIMKGKDENKYTWTKDIRNTIDMICGSK